MTNKVYYLQLFAIGIAIVSVLLFYYAYLCMPLEKRVLMSYICTGGIMVSALSILISTIYESRK